MRVNSQNMLKRYILQKILKYASVIKGVFMTNWPKLLTFVLSNLLNSYRHTGTQLKSDEVGRGGTKRLN